MPAPTLSVIIPTLNEADSLPALGAGLQRQTGLCFEVLVGDGGSTDATQTAAKRLGFDCIAAPRGRGAQMNAAARRARAADLLFLHADAALMAPDQLARACQTLETERRQAGHDRIAGHFQLRFFFDPNLPLGSLRYNEAKTGLNRPECVNGDQGLLLSARFFAALDGFDESLPFMEDQKISAQIARQGHWILLPERLGASARRFQREGFGRRTLLNVLIMAFHHVDWRAYFEHAPQLYRDQDQTRPLQLAPFFRLARRLHREEGRRAALRRWIAIGRYVKASAWQLFFMLDLRLFGDRRPPLRPFLALHDRVVGPLLSPRLFDPPVALFTWLWSWGAQAWFSRQESCAGGPPADAPTSAPPSPGQTP